MLLGQVSPNSLGWAGTSVLFLGFPRVNITGMWHHAQLHESFSFVLVLGFGFWRQGFSL